MFNYVGLDKFQWSSLIESIDNQAEVLEEIANVLSDVREELEKLNDKLEEQDNQE